MAINLVLYKSNRCLNSQTFIDIPQTLVAIHEAGHHSDAFAIFPDKDENEPHMIGFVGKNDIIHIYEPEKYDLNVRPEMVTAEIEELLNS